MRLIGLSGKAGAGKSTLAGLVGGRQYMYQAHFASKLRLVVKEAFGVSPLTAKTREVLPGITYRRLLQQVGQDFRAIDPDVWVAALARSLATCRAGYVIDDVRFENEARWIVEQGGCLFLLHGRMAALPEGEARDVSEALPAYIAERAILVRNFDDGTENLWREFLRVCPKGLLL